MEFQDTLIATNDYLHKSYLKSRNLLTDEWPPYQPRHYTTLALIHHKDKATDATVISVTQELAVAGKIQPMVEGSISPSSNISQTPNIYTNATKKISEIFVSVTASDGITINPCIVLIEGAPGIGKTVLAKEITFQWANNKILSDKKILFLVFLRQCNFKSMVSIESFVQCSVQSSEIAMLLTKYLLQTEGKELAIVFDGYDEISNEDRYNSIVANIIHRKIFAKSCLVITSRPTASSALHSIADCRVEIIGFTEEDRLDYIQTALQGNDEKVEALTIYLQSNPTINALCYIPLNITILLCLVEDGMDRLPKTQTDMYKKFIEMTIKRFIQKVDIKASEVISNITRLPCPYNEVFKELTKLAYNALKINKIVFKLNEIEEVCPNLVTISRNWSGLGLLKAVQHADAELGNVTFHFLHFSIQEYMAALYISTLSDNRQIKLLKGTFWEHRYYNTWIMYVGITCGSSFALKHFLSGNLFQFITKLFKTLSISNKYLKDKIKCLHLFQCLIESNNKDIIALVSQFFQGGKIDLSNQTLLPSDINTLTFFLMRSINNRCELLDISGCNIGSTGLKFLCDRFSDKESREMMVIKRVNFSFNNLNFFSLIEIFDLVKSWHTSELVIKDSEIFQSYRSSDIYKFINDTLFSSNNNNQVSLELGSFLLCYKITGFPMLLNTASCIKSIYLINCTLRSEISSLANLNLSEIHLINTYLPNQSMKLLCNNLLKCSNPNFFVYNAELPDQDADILYSILPSEITNGVMLIISKNKIQGIIDTFNICEQLTKLEILNLALNVNQKYSDGKKVSQWKENFYDNSNSDLIKDVFIEIFRKVNHNLQLKIILNEKDVLIAHKVNCECISEKIKSCVLKGIYLNDCNIINNNHQILLDTKETLTYLYILYSYTNQNFLMILNVNLLLCKEMFIHTLCDVSIEEISHFRKDCSTILVTKSLMFACNPTKKQIALALQLEPSINVLKLLQCQENFDCFNQIIAMLTTMQSNWTELDFMNCKLGVIEYEFLQRHLKNKNLTMKMLKVSSNQLTKPIIPKFIEIILMCKIQHLLFYDISQTVYESFVTRFITTIATVPLLVSYDRKKHLFFCNYNWNQITRLLEHLPGDTLYSVNCHFPSQVENLNITEPSHVSELHIINSTVHEDTIVDTLEAFIERKLKISIYYYTVHVNDMALYNFITRKKLLYQSRLSFVAVTKNLMCGFNATEDQLQFLLSKNLSDLECTIVTSMSNIQEMQSKELFVFQNKQLTALHLVGKASQTECITKLVAVLKRISTLKSLGIDVLYTITGKLASDIASALSHNKELEQLFFNSKLESTDLLNILEVISEKFTNLKIFEISNNSITDQEAKYLILIISRNLQLQYFNITNGNLSTTYVIEILKALQTTLSLQELTIFGYNTGVANVLTAIASNTRAIRKLQEFDISENNLHAKGVMKIAKDLQNIYTLTKLYINSNRITDAAADGIRIALSYNTQLQELDISNNWFGVRGIMKIAKGLQNISTLKKLYMSNCYITHEAAEDISIVLAHNRQLQEFDISKNTLQAKGFLKIAKALQDIYALKKLNISENYITEVAAESITHIVYRNVHLQQLILGFNGFASGGIVKISVALCNLTDLRALQIEQNEIDDKATYSIAKAISSSTKLEKFSCSGNHFTTECIVIIIKALQNISTLTKLDISNSNITNEAVDDLVDVIYNNIKLQELFAGKNNLQSKGVIKIAKSLQNISTLTKLYINNLRNSHIENTADELALALSCNNQLQELNINNNWFSTAGVVKIANALQNTFTLKKIYMSNNNVSVEAADSVAAALSCSSQLEVLDIGGNYVGTEGFIKIANALQKISSLQQLYIRNNNITDEASNDIVAICHHNTQLKVLDFHQNLFSLTWALKLNTECNKLLSLKKIICFR